MSSQLDSGYVEVIAEVLPGKVAPVGDECGAADTAPKMWGHKCILVRHTRRSVHSCVCGHTWYEPIEPEV